MIRLSALLCRLIILSLASSTAGAATTTLVAAGSFWNFKDDGSDQGTAWYGTGFNDAGWSSGQAQLGYGDTQVTLVSSGPASPNHTITTYFRKTFTVANPAIFAGLTLNLLRDDGAVVYVNGTEAYRVNMPAGAVSHLTLANATVSGADEESFFPAALPASLLVTGTNTIAVEIHQVDGSSSDIGFDLSLTASDLPTATRAAYLQTLSPTSVIVRWRTDVACDSLVNFGASTGSLTSSASSAALVTEHAVTLSGLSPDTRYYYDYGTTSLSLGGGDVNHFFYTAPVVGTRKATRIWAIGDSGTKDASAQAVRNAYATYAGSRYTDVWLMLGDNAYDSGTDSEFTAAVFDMYPAVLRQSALWPTMGNHDGVSADSPTETGPYYDAFNLPRAAEAGGRASGTEAYYSFDYANIHFICLDSQDTSRSTSGAMYTWLDLDLQDTLQEWIVAFWHHPPYTKGSHDSDLVSDSGGRMRDMRRDFLPLLESYGVDLVLTGHSHAYERSYLLDGHYDVSSTFDASMKVDPGNGKPAEGGTYSKPTLVQGPDEGAVYIVAGSSGQISGGTLNHPAMVYSVNSLGSLVIDVSGDQMDVAFINSATTPVVLDSFRIVKGPRPSASSINRAAASPTNAATIPFTVTFNQAVSGVDTADFSLLTTGVSGAAIASVVPVSPSVYTVSVGTGTGDGTIRLDLVDDDSIWNAGMVRIGGNGAGNGSFSTGQSYTIDRTSPGIALLQVSPAQTQPATALPVLFEVDFTEPVAGFSPGDIDFSGSTVPGVLTATVTGGTRRGLSGPFTVSVDGATASGTIAIGINGGGIADDAGNPGVTPGTAQVQYISASSAVGWMTLER